jgi:iron complex outermembrane receptor protein
VLRDGASAQYGADAIAGVLNLRLREASSGGGATVTYGGYLTRLRHRARPHTMRSTANSLRVAGWVGLPLLGDGFLTASGELQRARSHQPLRLSTPTLRSRRNAAVSAGQGDPESEDLGIYQRRQAAGRGLGRLWLRRLSAPLRLGSRRLPPAPDDNAQNVLGHLSERLPADHRCPIDDYNIYGGVRARPAGLRCGHQRGYGRNELDYRVENSLNPSYGAASKTRSTPAA